MQNNNNQKQKQHQDDADPTSNEKDATDCEETATSSTSPPPQVVYHSDVCSICQEDVSLLETTTFRIYTCCGKVMHTKCWNDLHGSKLSHKTRNSCPMCRAQNQAEGSKEEIRRLRKWTQKKKRWAQLMLGNMYGEGIGVPQDDKRAFVLFKLAADQGHHGAQYNLGISYAIGRGVNQSDSLSFKYWKLCAEQGVANAQYNVGIGYYTGKGVEQSDTKARECWTKAAAQGHEHAIRNLKQLDIMEKRTTTTSTIVTDNTITCFKCNKPQTNTHRLKNCGCKAAKYCNSTCQTGHWQEHKAEHRRIVKAKGLTNTEGEMKDEVTTDKKETATASTTHPEEEDEDICPICLDVLPKDPAKFLRMTCCGKGMHIACCEKKNNSKSMSMEQRNSCCLCRTKLNAAGSKEDLEQLRHHVKKGKGWSMAMLAQRYQTGLGVDQSWERTAHYFKMAVKHGDVGSMVSLGFLYMTGQGGEVDLEKTKELWMKAASFGDITAIKNLKTLDKTEGKTTPSFTPTPTFCSYCGKAHNPPTTKLNACTGCRSVFYCCKEHQRLDWRMKQNGHKEECGELKELNNQYQQNK
jgi:TPR repeat protein